MIEVKDVQAIDPKQRKINRVVEWLETAAYYVTRYKGLILAVHEQEPSGLKIWTEHDCVKWFNAAAIQAAALGCDRADMMCDTMPASRADDGEGESDGD